MIITFVDHFPCRRSAAFASSLNFLGIDRVDGNSVAFAVKESLGNEYDHSREQQRGKRTYYETCNICLAHKHIADSVELAVNRKIHIEVFTFGD